MAASHTAAREVTLRMAASFEPAGPAVADEMPASTVSCQPELHDIPSLGIFFLCLGVKA